MRKLQPSEMDSDRLFSDFPPVSTEEWEDQIRRDLLGTDAETLLWHLPGDITVRPYYRAEDIDDLSHVASDDAPFVEMPGSAKIRQDISTPDLQIAREHALAALAGGVDVLGISLRVFDGKYAGIPLISRTAFEDFAAGLPLDRTPVHLDAGCYSPALLALFLNHQEQRSVVRETELTVAFDPIGDLVATGRQLDGCFDMAAEMVEAAAERIPCGRVLQVGAQAFHNGGASPVQESAFLLASAVELFQELIERGIRAEDIIRHIYVAVPVASSYFVEIAKLRAMRSNISQVIAAYAPDQTLVLPPIHGESSRRNMTLYDPHTNLLRTSTEATSAIVGGCDVVSTNLFDELAGRFDEFSYRMARNIQHVLKQEAGMSRVVDPAAGSYYVEVLTDAIARRSWRLFQEVEENGGLIASLRAGLLQKQLDRSRAERQEAVSSRRRILVGTTQYPDADEVRQADLHAAPPPQNFPAATSPAFSGGFQELRKRLAHDEPISIMRSVPVERRLANPIAFTRDAEPVERIRLRTERSDRIPTLLLVPLGDAVVRSSRAHFARNFLECGGFRIVAPAGYASLPQALAAIREIEPDGVVFCAPDTEYGKLLAKVSRDAPDVISGLLTGIIAEPEVAHTLEDQSYDFAIHGASNLIDTLEYLQERFRDLQKLSDDE